MNQHMNRLRSERRDSHQCIDCGSPSRSSRCKRHLADHNAVMQSIRVTRKSLGLCVDCGEEAVILEIRCQRHKERAQEYIHRSRARASLRPRRLKGRAA